MIKMTLTITALSLSFSLFANNFGPMPSMLFGPKGSLSCATKETCTLPSYRALQKVAEDFLNYSHTRLESLDKIESEIRSGIQLYEQATDEIFSKSGHGPEKSFLEKGRSLFLELPSLMGLSDARQIVSNHSTFLNELKSLELLLKNSEAQIINSKTKDSIKELREQRKNDYYEFRTKGNFQSYKNVKQVKALIHHYEESGSISSWLKQNKHALRLKFKSCPLSIRRIIKKKKPSIKFDLKAEALQYDLKNTPDMLAILIKNDQLLEVECTNKQQGALNFTNDPVNGAIRVEYSLSSSGVPILPRFK